MFVENLARRSLACLHLVCVCLFFKRALRGLKQVGIFTFKQSQLRINKENNNTTLTSKNTTERTWHVFSENRKKLPTNSTFQIWSFKVLFLKKHAKQLYLITRSHNAKPATLEPLRSNYRTADNTIHSEAKWRSETESEIDLVTDAHFSRKRNFSQKPLNIPEWYSTSSYFTSAC